MFPKNAYGQFMDGNEAHRITTPMPPGVWWNGIVNG
jgi:hypothetical protein